MGDRIRSISKESIAFKGFDARIGIWLRYHGPDGDPESPPERPPPVSPPKSTKKDREIARNRKAFHDFTVEDSYEAGVVLRGSEVKSLRSGNVSLRDAYARFHDGELWLEGVHIAIYPQAGPDNHDPLRPRKLLLHRHELERLRGKVEQRGFTLVPLRIYLKRGIIKIQIGLCKGKRQYDKRERERRKTAEREAERAVKEWS